MRFKEGDKVKVGLVESRYYGEVAVVTDVLRNDMLRIVFDSPFFSGGYRTGSKNFIGICGFMDKRINKHKFIK